MTTFDNVGWFVSFKYCRWALVAIALFNLAGCQGKLPSFASGASDVRDCVYVQDNWVVPVQLPVVTNGRRHGSLKFVDKVADVGNAYCSVKGVRPFVIEGESPVLMNSPNVEMTVAGNICERSPLFIIYNVPFRGNPRYDNYYFHKLFGSYRGYDPMVRRISAAIAVTVKRCGVEPEEIRFVARKIKEVPQDVQWSAINSLWDKAPFEYTDFYSGRVIPKQSMRVISDNPEMEANYWRSEEQRVSKIERDNEEKARRQAVGAALGFLFMGAVINSNCQPENNSGGC